MTKEFEVGKYAINNKGIGIAIRKSTIYLVVAAKQFAELSMSICCKSYLMGKKLVCRVQYILIACKTKNFCYYGRKKRRGYSTLRQGECIKMKKVTAEIIEKIVF